ncbi:MAG: DUF4143 domain-containing protein [Prevotellaceae bacterium]|nr:DUF4143 domain-containing protein [Prevotellaceae bacterium]
MELQAQTQAADLKLFEPHDTAENILTAIYLAKRQRKPRRRHERTLLFIDEIQNSPQAVAMRNFWVREAKNAQAEVDFLFQYGRHLLPIEVKSGDIQS